MRGPAEGLLQTSPAPAGPPRNLAMSEHGSFEELAWFRAEWDEFALQAGGDVYLTYDWCRVWWAHYGHGRKLRVLILRDQNDVAAIVPICEGVHRIGPVSLRLAKFVGADSSGAVCTPLVRLEVAAGAFGQVLRHLFADGGVDAVSFGPMQGDWPGLAELRRVAAAEPLRWRLLRDEQTGVCSVLQVPKSVDAYLDAIGKSRRKHHRRHWRDLNQRAPARWETITDADGVATAFEEFVAMHQRQWQAEGRLGHFADWPRAVEFNRDMVGAQAAHGRVRMLRLLSGSCSVFSHLGYHFGNTYYWRLTARLRGPEWDGYGLGNLGMVGKIEAAIKCGARRVDAGLGHYDHKLEWGGHEQPVRQLLVVRATRGARARAALFVRTAQLLNLVYYRGWYLRVAPKLPWRRRGLWEAWIRSRV